MDPRATAAASAGASTQDGPALLSLRQALLADAPRALVLDDVAEREFHASDVFSQGATPALVVAPDSAPAVQDVVRACTTHGFAVFPRGAGLSYTGGFLPTTERSIVLDTSRLDRIVEINVEDMYVTVEVGCTWKRLDEALEPLGLRTPYFGPMSGFRSTVGGALSQGSVFLGSTQYGTTADSVLSLDVVTADGTLLSTGSAAGATRPSPFFRHFGPDLTGLFLHDAGALGVKVRATLQLIPRPPVSRHASFSYGTADSFLAAVAAISRSGLAAECFGTDPYVNSRRIHEQNLGKDLGYLKAVAGSGKSLLEGVGAAVRMAWKGRRSLGGESFVVHVNLDAGSDAAADDGLRRIRELAMLGGREIEATVPRSIRSLPFVYPNDLLGDRGERWVPTHCLAPHSRALEVVRAMERHFEEHERVLERHGIEWGYLVFAVSLRATLIEPLFYWPDARTPYHERQIEPAHLARLPAHAPNPAATAAVVALRRGLIDLFGRLGCAHLQIGKAYPFLDSRRPEYATLLRQVKAALDPGQLMNPGALGLADAGANS